MSAKILYYDNNNCLNSPKSVVSIELLLVSLSGRAGPEKSLVNSYLSTRVVIFFTLSIILFPFY